MSASVGESRITVILADDHSLVAGGIRLILEPEFDLLEVVDDGIKAVECVERLRPQIAIIDISLPRVNGIEALREIKGAEGRTRVIMLTGMEDVAVATEAFRSGANGYVLKQAAPTELVTAVREVAEGRTYITPRIANEVLQRLMDPTTKTAEKEQLTHRERQILQLVAEGHSAKEAAKTLGVTPRTVEFHKRNIMAKTGHHTTAELARFAAQKGFVPELPDLKGKD